MLAPQIVRDNVSSRVSILIFLKTTFKKLCLYEWNKNDRSANYFRIAPFHCQFVPHIPVKYAVLEKCLKHINSTIQSIAPHQ